jgi:hypothetical protein
MIAFTLHVVQVQVWDDEARSVLGQVQEGSMVAVEGYISHNESAVSAAAITAAYTAHHNGHCWCYMSSHAPICFALKKCAVVAHSSGLDAACSAQPGYRW